MWGVNGACGVLGSVMAVAVSMWVGIQANLFAAALIYAGLAAPLVLLRRVAADTPERTADITREDAARESAGGYRTGR
jgi:hypothetical protein